MNKGVKSNNQYFGVIVERDEDGFYIAECPSLKGCHAQGETLDETLKNIKEVIELCLEDDKPILSHYTDLSIHSVLV